MEQVVASKLRLMMKEETKPHILLVEDARDIREPLARYLREHSYRATTAQDAASARKVMKSSAIDLVVLDIMMPGEDGHHDVQNHQIDGGALHHLAGAGGILGRGGAVAMLPQVPGQGLADIARILHQQDMRLGFFFHHKAQF